jgi:hypothetical protein
LAAAVSSGFAACYWYLASQIENPPPLLFGRGRQTADQVGGEKRPAKQDSSAIDPHRHHRRGLRGDRTHASARQRWVRARADAKGERQIWLDRAVVDRLAAMRSHGESYSDVILRPREIEAKSRLQRGGRRPPAAFPAVKASLITLRHPSLKQRLLG